MKKERSETGEAPCALDRATRLGNEAAAWGFDWPDVNGPLEKVEEELKELREVIREQESSARAREELGDLLFAVVNVARHLSISAKEALEEANQKFEWRVGHVAHRMEVEGGDAISLERLEIYWQEAKEREE